MPLDEDFERWVKLAEWRGKTVQAIIDMDKDISDNKELINLVKKELKAEIVYLKKENKELRKSQKELYIKVATLAGTVGTIMTIVTTIISNTIGG